MPKHYTNKSPAKLNAARQKKDVVRVRPGQIKSQIREPNKPGPGAPGGFDLNKHNTRAHLSYESTLAKQTTGDLAKKAVKKSKAKEAAFRKDRRTKISRNR